MSYKKLMKSIDDLATQGPVDRTDLTTTALAFAMGRLDEKRCKWLVKAIGEYQEALWVDMEKRNEEHRKAMETNNG